MAGVTTVRDLGSEGAGYGDVGLKQAINKGVVPGPRMLVAGPALVATGSYNPKGAPEWHLPKGAQEADGHDDLIRATRGQIGRGADWVKVYAGYRWGPDRQARPTYTEQELRLVVEVGRAPVGGSSPMRPPPRLWRGRYAPACAPSNTVMAGRSRSLRSWLSGASASAQRSLRATRSASRAVGEKAWILSQRACKGKEHRLP